MINVSNLTHYFGSTKILEDVSFSVEKGEIMALLGPSGSGKSTLFDCLAGFLTSRTGKIKIGEETYQDPAQGIFVAPEKREVGLIFQEANLFPHLTIEDNVAYGLYGQSKSNQAKMVESWLKLIRLEAHGKKLPHELSGGEQQRAALARALAPNPKICLLDEPFSKLDTDLKKGLRQEVRQILKKENTTSIIVTHDLEEALEFADKVCAIKEGKVVDYEK